MAPSTTSALHPIVINPFQVPPHFLTLGTGLLYDTYARESASTLETLLLSKPPLITNQSKSKSWWRAQCLLYGLNAPASRTIQDLRDTLEMELEKPGGLTVPGDLVELEHKENGKFRKLNAQVREATGKGGDRLNENKGKGIDSLSKENKTAAKAPKTTAANSKTAAASSKKGKKDPLKITKGAPKVKKLQPVNNSTTPINISITVTGAPTAPSQPKTTPRKDTTGIPSQGLSIKQRAVKTSSKLAHQLAPKSRAKQAPRKVAGGFKTETKSSPLKPKPKPKPHTKQAAAKGTDSNAFKTEPDTSNPKVARAKQTARRTKIKPNVKGK